MTEDAADACDVDSQAVEGVDSGLGIHLGSQLLAHAYLVIVGVNFGAADYEHFLCPFGAGPQSLHCSPAVIGNFGGYDLLRAVMDAFD